MCSGRAFKGSEGPCWCGEGVFGGWLEHYETATLPALVLPALPSLPNTERDGTNTGRKENRNMYSCNRPEKCEHGERNGRHRKWTRDGGRGPLRRRRRPRCDSGARPARAASASTLTAASSACVTRRRPPVAVRRRQRSQPPSPPFAQEHQHWLDMCRRLEASEKRRAAARARGDAARTRYAHEQRLKVW